MVCSVRTASRIVLDLNMPARVKKSFILPPPGGKPYRLVLDIVKTSHNGMVANEQTSRHKVNLTYRRHERYYWGHRVENPIP